jgi:hypothetical protein
MHLQPLDFFLTLVHFIIIGFNLLGWIWKLTRKLHFYLVMTTIFCWIALAPWFGFGYCPVTDWQWQIKTSLGEQDLPNSFIKYMADKITGLDISSVFIDTITAASFGIVIIITVYLKVVQRRKNVCKE